MVNPVVATAPLPTTFYIAANKEYLMKRQIIVKCTYLAFPPLYWLKFSFKLVAISKCYARKQNGLFF